MAKTSLPLVCGISVFIAAITWIVFGQTIHDGFVNFDDDAYVSENPVVQEGFTPRGIGWAFTHVEASNWHPLTTMSHMADCQFFGLDAGKHHLTNVILHGVTAILLFLILLQMTGALWPSTFVAAVFAIHPLRAESVAWVSERKDVLSGLFFMLTLGAYVRYARAPSLKRYLPVLVLFALGLLSKPMLVTLPFILLLLDYWPLKRFPSGANGGFSIPRRFITEKIPLLLMSLVACVVVYAVQEKARQAARNFSFPMRISNAVVSYAAYIGQLFFPAKLAVFYPYPAAGHSIVIIVISVLVLGGISVMVFSFGRKYPCLPVGWLWYVVMLLPVIGLIQVAAQARADRYTYLPEIGLCVALAWLAGDLTRSWPNRSVLLGAAAGLIILVLIPVAHAQVAWWHDSKSLWEHCLACTANNSIAQENLANELLREGNFDGAIEHASASLEIDPRFADAHNCLGYALFQTGQVNGAIAHFQEALNIQPDFASAHDNLGLALWRTGKLDEAIAQFQAAVKIQPGMADAHNNLGAALVQNGQPEAAAAQYQMAIDLKPDFVGAENNYAYLLASSTNAAVRNGAKAVELAQRANQLSESKNLIILRTLAAAYAENGQFVQALDTAGQALQIAITQNNPAWIHAIEAEISLYRANQPFRADGKTP